MYVADLGNDVIYVINRENLTELERFGGGGRQAGEFHWPHMVSCRFRGKYLCRRGRWRRESSEVPALWFDGLQRHRQSGCGSVHPVKIEMPAPQSGCQMTWMPHGRQKTVLFLVSSLDSKKRSA